jgi:hypothetical protein
VPPPDAAKIYGDMGQTERKNGHRRLYYGVLPNGGLKIGVFGVVKVKCLLCPCDFFEEFVCHE